VSTFLSLRGVAVVLPCLLLAGGAMTQPPPPPPARVIPGITGEDAFPLACVDCHVNRPEINLDVRLSTVLGRWRDHVDARALAASRAAGFAPTGRHPDSSEAVADVPTRCLDCHAAGSSEAPEFARLMHAIHLTGGEENHFLTLFQGECTHCHKLDPATAAWRVPSAPEK